MRVLLAVKKDRRYQQVTLSRNYKCVKIVHIWSQWLFVFGATPTTPIGDLIIPFDGMIDANVKGGKGFT